MSNKRKKRSDPDLNHLLGSRVRELRLDAELTQIQLAERLGYTRQACISNIERGHKGFTFVSLVSICLAFNISPNELFCWDGE